MYSIEPVYLLMFLSGFFGGFGHCTGMCGPFVAACSLDSRQGLITSHLLYNSGRIVTYSMIGGVMGIAGSFVGIASRIENLQTVIMASAGVLMILIGISAGGWLPLRCRARATGGGILGRAVRFVSENRGTGVFFPIGLILGFIPCGLSYTAFIAAAAAGAESGNQIEGGVRGALMLLIFGLGTAPALLLLGWIVGVAGEGIRRKLRSAAAVMMMASGFIFLYRALSVL